MTDTPRSNSSFRTGTSRQQKDTFDLALQSSAKDSKSRSSFSILPTRHNAQPLAFQTSDEPPALRRAKAAIEHGPAFSGFPTRHREQSPEEHISKPHDDDGDEEYNAEIRPWRDVHRAFLTCHGRIFGTRELRESELGETWLGIAGRRMQWTKEDETKLLARVQKSKSLRNPVDDYELKRVCRKQEDRLRRLLGAIDVVAARPWDASKEYAAGMTYDQKVQQTLRETYEKCAKARKAFIRDVDEAVKNEEASES